MSDSSRYRLPDERELQRAIGETKTERVGDCPDEATLRRFVSGAYARDGQRLPALIEHLADCPDCEATLRRIRGEQSLRSNFQDAQASRRNGLLRASAYIVLSMIVLAAIWFWKTREPIPETVTIDLRLVTRGVEGSSQPSVTFHRRAVQVRVLLPKENAPGKYDLGIFQPSDQTSPLFVKLASAVLENDGSSVQATFPMQKLPPGNYLLGIRDGTSPWSYYPFTLK